MRGNPVVRSVLVESSWVLIGKDPEMRRFYDRIKVRRGGKRAPDPNKRPVAKTTNRMLKLLALP